MKRDFYYPSYDGVTQIHAIEFIPDNEIKAVLQISHGMADHISRYEDFANYLNLHGIYVVGNDHLGHGKSVTDKSKLGFFKQPNGNECLIKDIHELRCITHRKYPNLPYFVMGHSMGSFLIRQYMIINGNGIKGAIIMGSGWQPDFLLSIGKAFCKILAKFRGWEYRCNSMLKLAFFSYNKKFQPVRTPFDWLTRDEKVIDNFANDPYSGFTFTLNGFYQMFYSIKYIQNKNNIVNTPKNASILLVSGSDDPVGKYGKGVKKIMDVYKNLGISNVKMKLYKDDRHGILHELDKETVFKDLKNWIISNC